MRPVVRQVTDYFEFPGQTEAVSEVAIRARVMGYIVKVNFNDGQNVKKGDCCSRSIRGPTRPSWTGRKANWCGWRPFATRPRPTWRAASGCAPRRGQRGRVEQHVAQLKIAKASIATAEGGSHRSRIEPGVHQNHLADRRPGEPRPDQGGEPGPVGRRFARADHGGHHRIRSTSISTSTNTPCSSTSSLPFAPARSCTPAA